jgi:arsenate reductase
MQREIGGVASDGRRDVSSSRRLALRAEQPFGVGDHSDPNQSLIMGIVIYQKPTCSTCRQVYTTLKDSGVNFESVDYYTDPIPRAKLKELLKKMGIPARDLLRTGEAIYKQLRLGERELTEAEIIDAMVEHPDLIQRPIVEKGDRAVLARPPERLREVL